MDKNIWTKIYKFSKKLKAINYLDGKCEMCGEDNFFKLCFHHIDDKEKENNLNKMKQSRWSKIEIEISKCKLLCQNCHQKLHNNNKTNRYKTNKRIFLEFKGINGCEKCGYNKNNSSLDFHHFDKKNFILSNISITCNNINKLTFEIENEINKCVVLCKNCHSLEHADVEFFEKYKDIILEKSKNLKEIQPKIDRSKVKELYESGMKQVDISKYFNSKKGTISEIIKELGLRI